MVFIYIQACWIRRHDHDYSLLLSFFHLILLTLRLIACHVMSCQITLGDWIVSLTNEHSISRLSMGNAGSIIPSLLPVPLSLILHARFIRPSVFPSFFVIITMAITSIMVPGAAFVRTSDQRVAGNAILRPYIVLYSTMLLDQILLIRMDRHQYQWPKDRLLIGRQQIYVQNSFMSHSHFLPHRGRIEG